MKQKKLGRKPIADKKQVLRIFIEQSVIDANGGETICKDECISFLKKAWAKKRKIKPDLNHKMPIRRWKVALAGNGCGLNVSNFLPN